jgi:hypothetical protein
MDGIANSFKCGGTFSGESPALGFSSRPCAPFHPVETARISVAVVRNSDVNKVWNPFGIKINYPALLVGLRSNLPILFHGFRDLICSGTHEYQFTFLVHIRWSNLVFIRFLTESPRLSAKILASKSFLGGRSTFSFQGTI